MISAALSEARRPLTPADVIARLHFSAAPRNRPETKQRVSKILWYEAQRRHGLYMAHGGGYVLRNRVEKALRKRVKRDLAGMNLDFHRGGPKNRENTSKGEIRRLHNGARREKLRACQQFLREHEADLVKSFADGAEIDIHQLHPRLEVVESRTRASRLFRYATLLWSVPVSQGFGRRVRFLVWDRHTEKLLGLFALGDPVFNLNCRDQWIGWDYQHRTERLYNVMDVFVLGAVPPYNTLLGGKLIAMLAASNEVRAVIARRYKGQQTVIEKSKKDPRLALLTTASALGKSALYNRISYRGRVLYQSIGESKGFGHFHLDRSLFTALRQYVQATLGDGVGGNRFGDGPNWKIRTARSALECLGMPGDLMRHGVRREIFGIPLAENFDAFLRQETSRLRLFDIPFDDVAEHWKQRWLMGRAERKPEYRTFDRRAVSKAIHDAVALGE